MLPFGALISSVFKMILPAGVQLTHLYLGRQYRLKIVPDNIDVVKAYRGQLWLHSQNPKPIKLTKNIHNRWTLLSVPVIYMQQ